MTARSDRTSQARAVAVVDIDGVLADVRHRLHHLEGRKRWDRFFAAAPRDPLLQVGYDTVMALAEVYDIVYLSGRPEHCRADTEAWFAQHALPSGELRLRPHNDMRPARFFKLDQLRAIAHHRTVAVLVDDDEAVCDTARMAGFDVLPATWMGDAPLLHEAQEEDGRT